MLGPRWDFYLPAQALHNGRLGPPDGKPEVGTDGSRSIVASGKTAGNPWMHSPATQVQSLDWRSGCAAVWVWPVGEGLVPYQRTLAHRAVSSRAEAALCVSWTVGEASEEPHLVETNGMTANQVPAVRSVVCG